MKKNFHFSRKYRQLKYAVKQLKNSKPNDLAWSRSLVLKIKRLIEQLKSVMPAYRLKRLVAPILMVLGTAVQNPVEAQAFADPVRSPYGILTTNPLFVVPALVDIDGDGDLDLLKSSISYFNSSDFYFQENTGTSNEPEFAELKANPFQLQSVYLGFYHTFGDLDDDGDFDIIMGAYYGIAFYENVGTKQQATFAAPVLNPFNIKVNENQIPELVDFDNDGDLDILTTNTNGNILYHQNTGDKNKPDFVEPEINPFGLNAFEEEYLTFLRVVDIDADADLDIVAGIQTDFNDYYEASLFYYENIGDTSTPNFESVDSVLLSKEIFNSFALPTLGDLDADGDLDLIASQNFDPTLYFENEGNANEPMFNAGVENAFGITDPEIIGLFSIDVNTISVPELVDLDADGDLDLVYGGVNRVSYFNTDTVYGKLKFYENTGTQTEPQFALPTASLFENVNTYNAANPAFSDVDMDGDLDLFVSDYFGKVTYFENTGNAQNPVFEEPLENPFGLVFEDYYFSKVVFADVDNDGDEDCFNTSYGNIVYFENTSTADGEISFQKNENNFNIELPAAININDYLFFDIVDIDNDGDFDVLLFSYDNNVFYYYQNTGTPQNASLAEIGSFSLTSPYYSGYDYDDVYLVYPVFADLDDDGDLDILFGSLNYLTGNLYYYESIDGIQVNPISIFENELKDISIYPNPATDLLNINNSKAIQKVEIFNSLGQTVKHFQKPQQSISLEGLPSATYFIKIIDRDGLQVVKKLYKQ